MLSLANVSAAQAENYYERDDYYTRGDEERDTAGDIQSDIKIKSDSQWQGHGAIALGLTGEVDKNIFQQLLHGQSPAGKPLHSKAIKADTHRAATDYTLSAPKSVSIAALIQKDKRVINAHDIAVKTALTVLESRYAQTRVRRGPGIRENVKTGNIVAATFRHETSREQDPQLHTHCVVINATQLANGRWQSLSNEEVLTNQKLLGEIYQNELAVQLRQCGYEIAPKGNGQFECKGYDEPLLDLFSTRTQQIEAYIDRWEAALKTANGKPLHAKQKKQATLATRVRKKTVPREVLLEGWHRAVESGDVHLPDIPTAAQAKLESQALSAAAEGVDHAAERESVFKVEKAERFALEHHLGEQSFAELQSAMSAAGLVSAKDRYTTAQAIERELETISIMETGQGQADAISNSMDVLTLTRAETTLTTGQYQAILETATSRDQFMAWQGVAGAGKTYSLKLLTQLATDQGYAVTGYAPSAQAATVLSEEAQIEGNTVARLLHSKDTDTGSEKEIWIVDEAGLLSAKDAHALLQKAQATQARVILVGDTRQLSAVEAGNPFKSLQSAGMNTCYLEESRRQKTDALRAAVVCLAAGEQREGLEQLDSAGMVHELASSDARHQAITLDYMSLTPQAREKTLILSGTNVERLALTAELRAALQREGSLGADAFTLRSLRSQDRTAVQLKYACAYDVGDVVVPVRDYPRYGMQRREQYPVQVRDLERNQLTLQGPAGELFTFDPAGCADKTTYAVQTIAIAPGDQLRWTRNEAAPGVRNGQTVTVEAIDASGIATLRDGKGGTLTLDLNGQQYLDYALVSTTYSSQGKTADQVLADIDSTLSKEGLYVAVSRAKSNLKLYTADKPQLYKRAQRSAAKENPSDYLTLFEMVNPDAENEKAAADTRKVRGADQSEHIGARAGERYAVGYEADAGRDERPEAESERARRTAASISRSVRANAAESHRAATDASGQLASAASRKRAQLEQDGKRRRRRQVYEQYAAKFVGKRPDECDQLVVRQMMGELLAKSGRRSLREEEVLKVGRVLLQGPVAQELKRTEGKEAGLKYAGEVLVEAQKIVERERQAKPSKGRSRDRGMER